MKKTKLILSSILTLVLCVSMIAGGSFALFTSENNTNIAITSGNVDVTAAVTVEALYSPTAIDLNGKITDADNAATDTFFNGGEVDVDGSKVTITNMTPGDKATFKLTITNNSTVKFLERISFVCNDADKAFFGELLVSLQSADPASTDAPMYIAEAVSPWMEMDPANGAVEEILFNIELPSYVSTKWEGKTCSFDVNVFAVQGNADMVDTQNVKEIYMVDSQEALNNAIEKAVDGDTIVLADADWSNVTITYDVVKTLNLRGHKIGTLVLNAPEGTLHVYNSVDNLDAKAVAQSSLHIYGTVANVTIEQGRVVVENTATIEKVELAPQTADAVVKLEVAAVAPAVTPEAEVVVPKVEQVVVNAAVAEAKVVIAAPKATTAAPVVPELPVIEYAEESAVTEESVTIEAVTENGAVPFITTQAELDAAAQAAVVGEETTLVLADGIYTLPTKAMQNKNFVILGSSAVVLNLSTASTSHTQAASGATLTFDGVTINYHATTNYQGLAHVAKVVYKNCTFNGKFCLYSDAEFINCTFNNASDYAVWTWGANNVSFTDCTFYSGGKALLVYADTKTADFTVNLTLTNCDFYDDDTLNTVKAAVETGVNPKSDSTVYNITMTDCTVNGYAENDEGIATGSTYWGNKSSLDTDHLNVVIDGTDVY